jgi:hypothetical protein
LDRLNGDGASLKNRDGRRGGGRSCELRFAPGMRVLEVWQGSTSVGNGCGWQPRLLSVGPASGLLRAEVGRRSGRRSPVDPRHGRSRRARSRATACGASACSWWATKTIL